MIDDLASLLTMRKAVFLPLLLFPFLCLAVAAQPRFGYDILTLRNSGIMLLATTGDVNGDSQPDLFTFHKPAKESYEKSCSVYVQRRRTFSAAPQAVFSIGPSVSAVASADIDSDGIDELCGFDSKGVVLFDPDKGLTFKVSRLVEKRTILPNATRRLTHVDWVADINCDGRPDLLLPVQDGIRVFIQKEHLHFVEDRLFEFPINGSVTQEGDQHYVSLRLPHIDIADFDKDGHNDVGLFDLERMDYFLTNGGNEPVRYVTSPLVREFSKDFIMATDFPDLNADGIPDAVAVLLSQKKNLQSEVRIYFATDKLSYGPKPAHVFSGDSNLLFPVFLDATGNGRKEMLLQNIDVGFSFFLNYFLANRIAVKLELRRLSSEMRYEDKPAVTRTIHIRVSESGTEPARSTGDFNGDGLEDIVVGTDENRLSFFLSNKIEFMPENPSFELEAPAYGTITTLRLNSDSRTDFVILYPDEEKQNLAVLFISA